MFKDQYITEKVTVKVSNKKKTYTFITAKGEKGLPIIEMGLLGLLSKLIDNNYKFMGIN